MAVSTQYTDIDDAVIAALRNLGRARFTDAVSTYQKYVAFKTLMRGAYVESTQEYGKQWNVMKATNGAAIHASLYQVDDLSVGSHLTTARVDMRHTKANWSYDLHEIDMNVRTPEARILSLVKVRRAACMIDIAELMEADFWTLPSASDTLAPFGVPYYIVNSSSAIGFNGANPSGYSTCANIDSDVVTKWRNMTARYVLLTVDDFIEKLEECMDKTKWEPPVDINDYNTGDMVGLYTNYVVYKKMKIMAREQNDQLGRDLAKWGNSVMFHGTPVTYVPFLDSSSKQPIYGINWGDFKVLVDKDWFLKESEPRIAPTQSDVRTVFTNVSWNLKCTNRRKQFIMDIA